jgi:putative glutamine amidotransferase
MQVSELTRRPVIGCTTYRKLVQQEPPFVIYGVAPAYVEAIVAAGGIPLLIPLGLGDNDLAALVEHLDGLILTGGGDVAPERYGGQRHPAVKDVDNERDRIEFTLVKQIMGRRKPVLAICRGCQLFNVALGGTLWEDIASQKSGALSHDLNNIQPRNHLGHTVNIEAGSALARYLGTTTTWVNTLHHQGIRELGPGLRITAVAPDGLIEGVEIPDHPYAIGVQWHPEWLVASDPAMLSLFKGLVQVAGSNNDSISSS